MEKMNTGQIKYVKYAKLISSPKQIVTDDIYIDLQTLEYIILSDNNPNNNYLFYKSDENTYFPANTLVLYDFNTNTLKPLHIHIDYCAIAVKIYKNLLFVATDSNDITVYNFNTLEYIKTLYTGLKNLHYLTDYITIYEDNATDMQNLFVLTKNYKYNTIINFNTGEFIQYPKSLRDIIWNIYIDTIDNKVYLYSPYRIIVFTDTTFQNYKSIHTFINPVYSYSFYRVDNYLHVGGIKIDSTTYEQIDDKYVMYNAGTTPYFRYPYILFKDRCNIIVTDYNLQQLDSITMCSEPDDEIQQMYVCGYKVYCLIYDGSIKTIPIYYTEKHVSDMNKYLVDCQLFPPELITSIMSYVGNVP